MRRDEIPSPALIIDLDVLDRNIAVMADHANAVKVALRPHVKAHKCTQVAHRLNQAGAIGASCATLDEAEAMAVAGIGGILVTSPVPTRPMLERVRKLLLRRTDLLLVVDTPQSVLDLAEIAGASGTKLPLVVELDVGVGRTGCLTPEKACKLARLIEKTSGVDFAGIQGYWGNLQQVVPFEDRQARVAEQAKRVRSLIEFLEEAGIPPGIVTGGGTGTSFIDPPLGIFTEIQPGSFIFLDSCYAPIIIDGKGNPFTPSLFVSASVVSSNQPGRAIVNAGWKAFGTDSGLPAVTKGAPKESRFTYMGDEHGAVDFDESSQVDTGTTIEFLTSHCDPTVNLHQRFVVVRDQQVVDIWPIRARGY